MTVGELLDVLSHYVQQVPEGAARDVELCVEGLTKPLAIADVTGVAFPVSLEAEDDELTDEEYEAQAETVRTWQELARALSAGTETSE